MSGNHRCRGSWGTAEINIFRSPHGRMSGGSRLYWHSVTFLWFQCPFSPKPVLEEGQLEVHQSWKESERPEFPFCVAAGSAFTGL